MAKKGEITEEPIKEPIEEPVKNPVLEKETKKEPVNIMDTENSNEPKKPKKEKESEPLDLGPVMEKIDKLAAAITPKEEPKKEPEKSKKPEFEENFLSPLGDW